jgi:hypothetical protein
MTAQKPTGHKADRKATIPLITLGTFARAAGAANLIVGTLVLVEFSVFSLVNRAGRDILLGLWLILFVTIVIWTIASLMGVVVLGSKWIWNRGHSLVRRVAGSSPASASSLWDEWLDSAA